MLKSDGENMHREHPCVHVITADLVQRTKSCILLAEDSSSFITNCLTASAWANGLLHLEALHTYWQLGTGHSHCYPFGSGGLGDLFYRAELAKKLYWEKFRCTT